MTEERKKILTMLSEGKISTEDADNLLNAIKEEGIKDTSINQKESRKKIFPDYLYVIVEPKSKGKDKVNIKIPLKLLKAGVKLASLMPHSLQEQVNASLKKEGIDFDIESINRENFTDFILTLTAVSIDVESENERLKIYCE